MARGERQTINSRDVGAMPAAVLEDANAAPDPGPPLRLEGHPDEPTVQQRIDAILDKLGHTDENPVTWARKPQADKTVIVFVQTPDGDRISGRGPTTADAVTALEEKVEARK